MLLKSSSVNVRRYFVCTTFARKKTLGVKASPSEPLGCDSPLARSPSRQLHGSPTRQVLSNKLNMQSRHYRHRCQKTSRTSIHHQHSCSKPCQALTSLALRIEVRAEPFLGGSGGAAFVFRRRHQRGCWAIDLSFRNLATMRNAVLPGLLAPPGILTLHSCCDVPSITELRSSLPIQTKFGVWNTGGD